MSLGDLKFALTIIGLMAHEKIRRRREPVERLDRTHHGRATPPDCCGCVRQLPQHYPASVRGSAPRFVTKIPLVVSESATPLFVSLSATPLFFFAQCLPRAADGMRGMPSQAASTGVTLGAACRGASSRRAESCRGAAVGADRAAHAGGGRAPSNSAQGCAWG